MPARCRRGRAPRPADHAAPAQRGGARRPRRRSSPSSFWPSTAEPARDRDLAAGEPAGREANTTIISATRHHVEAERQHPCPHALVAGVVLYEFQQRTLPIADHRGGGVREPGRGRESAGSDCATTRPAALRCSSAQAAAAARPPSSTITAWSPLSIWVSTAATGPGRPGIRGHAVASAGEPRLDPAEHVRGAHEVLPAGEHLAAQQRAVLRRLVDRVQRRLVLGGDRRLLLKSSQSIGVLPSLGDLRQPDAAGRGWCRRAVRAAIPRSSARSPAIEVVQSRGPATASGSSVPSSPSGCSSMDEDGSLAEPAVGEHPAQVGQHVVHCPRGYTVQRPRP